MAGLRCGILVGSINYSKSPLNFPLKDVDDFSNVLLKRCHFNQENLQILKFDKHSLSEDINKLLFDSISNIDVHKKSTLDLVLFYYSGHGFYDNVTEETYLKISDKENIRLLEILKSISHIKARNKYIIIDACQSGGLTILNAKSYIERRYSFNSEGFYCLLGATSETLAFEPSLKQQVKKKIQNSYFTHFIIEALNTRSKYEDSTISIKIIDDYATRKTPTYTDFAQIPFSTTQVKGFFPFGFWDDSESLEDIDFGNTIYTEPTSQNGNEDQIIGYLSEKLRALYNEDDKYHISYFDTNLFKNLSNPGIDILNAELKLEKKKFNNKPLINGLISSGDHMNFLTKILEIDSIKVDVNLKDENGKTALEEIIDNRDAPISLIFSLIPLLFKNGYKTNVTEYEFIKDELAKTDLPPEKIDKLALSYLLLKMNNGEFADRIFKIYKVLFSILSFQLNRIIGYRFPNHLSLANNFLQHHNKYFNVFLKAIDIYGLGTELRMKDSFNTKVQKLIANPVFQEEENNDIIFKLFPELSN